MPNRFTSRAVPVRDAHRLTDTSPTPWAAWNVVATVASVAAASRPDVRGGRTAPGAAHGALPEAPSRSPLGFEPSRTSTARAASSVAVGRLGGGVPTAVDPPLREVPRHDQPIGRLHRGEVPPEDPVQERFVVVAVPAGPALPAAHLCTAPSVTALQTSLPGSATPSPSSGDATRQPRASDRRSPPSQASSKSSVTATRRPRSSPSAASSYSMPASRG